jgi:hypothetical protein
MHGSYTPLAIVAYLPKRENLLAKRGCALNFARSATFGKGW